jgi:SulP family sulfate permease
VLDIIKNQIPLLASLKGYSGAHFKGDLTAGFTTAVMLVPQGMAYAMLAGLPPIVGLYASTVPLVVYALLGHSRQLAVGPVAMVSLMVAAAVGGMAEQGTPAYLGYAILLAAMVGVFQLVMGVARMGILTNFLSHPVVSGFTSAAALIIGFSQLKHLLGLQIPRSHQVHAILHGAASRLGEVEPVTLLIGGASIATLILLKRWKPTFPAALVVVALSTLAVWALRLDLRGVAIVGTVPDGFPRPTLPGLDLAAIRELLPIAVAISLVGFMESISVARAVARRHRYDVDANRELVGLGAANIASALFGGYPVTGGFSRTAVNDQAGARTGLASIITAAVIAVILLLLTPLFYYLPKAVLAAIIMVAVFGLVDLHEVRHLWRVKRGDLVLLLVTFAATLTLGIEEGIMVGVGTSLAAVIFRTTRPHAALLGRVPGTHVYRSLERFPEAETIPGVIVIRIDAQFYFGNVTFLKESIKKLENGCEFSLRAIVINASSINQLDSSADAALREIALDLRERGVELYMAEVRGPVREVMRRSGFEALLGEDHFFMTVRRAVERAQLADDAGPRPDGSAAAPSLDDVYRPVAQPQAELKHGRVRDLLNAPRLAETPLKQ